MRKQTKLWTTKNGNRIRICDMSNTHLLHTVVLLQLWAEVKRITTVDFYANTPGPEGEMAQYAFDQEFDTAMDSTYRDYLPEIYSNLELEAERRGLEVPKQPQRTDLEIALVTKHAGVRG